MSSYSVVNILLVCFWITTRIKLWEKNGKMSQINLDIFNTDSGPHSGIPNDRVRPSSIVPNRNNVDTTQNVEYTEIQTRPAYVNAALAYDGIKKVRIETARLCADCSTGARKIWVQVQACRVRGNQAWASDRRHDHPLSWRRHWQCSFRVVIHGASHLT